MEFDFRASVKWYLTTKLPEEDSSLYPPLSAILSASKVYP